MRARGLLLLSLTGVLPWTVAAQLIAPPLEWRAPLRYESANEGLSFPRWEEGRTEIEMADINGDGHVDLVSVGDHGNPLVNSDEHGIMVFFGNGRGRWSAEMSGSFGYGGVAVGDLNGDGLADVAYGMHHNWSSQDFGDQILEAALGNGEGSAWQPWDDGLASNGETWGMFGTDLADVDGDGDLDLAATGFGGSSGLRIYINLGDGSWLQSWAIANGNSYLDLVFGEVNGDGLPDLCVGFQHGTIYLGDGQGGFSAGDGNLPGAASSRQGPSLGDVDADGRDDLAWANSSGGLQVWLARGSGNWVNASVGLPLSGSYAGTQLWDLDGDGGAELIAQSRGSVQVFRAADRSWFEETLLTTTVPGKHAALRVGGDVDHNGRADIVAIANKDGRLFNRNQLLVFKETTPAREPAIRFEGLHTPRVLRGGAAEFIRFAAAIPPSAIATAEVDLAYSTEGPTGPWHVLAPARPASGRIQIVVPPEAVGGSAHFRLLLHTSAGEAEAISTAIDVEDMLLEAHSTAHNPR